jgi:hypothetical protein
MEHGTQPLARFARSVPAAATIPTAAADQQENDDNDQKCRGVHAALLKVIMRLRASRPRECLLGVSAPDARPLGLCYAAPVTKSVQY